MNKRITFLTVANLLGVACGGIFVHFIMLYLPSPLTDNEIYYFCGGMASVYLVNAKKLSK